MKVDYITPKTCLLDMSTEGQVMLTQSEYDEKHNTEYLEWDDAINI